MACESHEYFLKLLLSYTTLLDKTGRPFAIEGVIFQAVSRSFGQSESYFGCYFRFTFNFMYCFTLFLGFSQKFSQIVSQ